MIQAKQKGRGKTLSKKLARARTKAPTCLDVAQDVKVLADWLVEGVRIIQQSSEHLLLLITDILDLSKDE